MSLNFVSTTVLSSTDGVSHNAETRLETSGADTSTQSSGTYKPLYEQLRQNQQEEQDKYDEQTRAMRGAQALDDEDIAHLQGVENERAERLRQQAVQEKEELESFRLAKMDFHEANKAKQDVQREEDIMGKSLEKTKENKAMEGGDITYNTSSMAKLKPNIKVKKKRRRKQDTESNNVEKDNESLKKPKIKFDTKDLRKEETKSKDSKPKDKGEHTSGLGGLLHGYDSDSE